jgi:hypothetical protein
VVERVSRSSLEGTGVVFALELRVWVVHLATGYFFAAPQFQCEAFVVIGLIWIFMELMCCVLIYIICV